MGHAHITDFNVAIHYSERRLHTSIAGSMAYMAPEVVGRKGYSWWVDWWSLGVVAYELLFHRRPFDGRTSEKMTQSILKDSVKVPSSKTVSADAQDVLRGVSPSSCTPSHTLLTYALITQFLDRNPKTRLGCRDKELGIDDIRSHPWFASLDWDALENKDVQPPYVPDVRACTMTHCPSLTDALRR